jgi:hypothetical protein
LVPPYGIARIEKPLRSTVIRTGITEPTTMIVRETRPARPHDAVTAAGPLAARSGTRHDHRAWPRTAATVARSGCFEPLE